MAALRAIMTDFDTPCAAVFVRDETLSGRVEWGVFAGTPEGAAETYRHHFATKDVRAPAILGLAPGRVFVDDRAMPFADVLASEIFNELYRPIRMGRSLSVIPLRDRRRTCALSTHRDVAEGPFPDALVARFEALVPHMTRALQVQRQVSIAQKRAGALKLALDHFPTGVLVVDVSGRVVSMNAAAEALLAASDCPLRTAFSRLSTRDPNDAAWLVAALRDAVRTGRAGDGGVVPVRRLRERDAHLAVMVAPMRDTNPLAPGHEPLALVFVSAPSSAPPPMTDVLMRQFGLTPAEARVTARLAAGEGTEEIAARHGATRETVRQQIKSALAKTGARGQGQLIGLVLRSLAALRRPAGS
jgi:DNA-binding CsgD family transcriptional regulator/PAS domain-containing protein